MQDAGERGRTLLLSRLKIAHTKKLPDILKGSLAPEAAFSVSPLYGIQEVFCVFSRGEKIEI